MDDAIHFLNDETEVDFVSIGCPHCSINEIAEIAGLLKGKKVTKETWITTARPIKHIADKMGYTKAIEDSGAKFACDTCLAVAPLKGRFKAIATNSAKGCYYGRGSNAFKTRFMPLEDCLMEATK
jgi:predicted aconitase